MVVDAFTWTQPGLMAMPETDGHGDTCGVIVIADYIHLLGKVNLTITDIDNMRSNLISWGLMDSQGEVGMTVSQVAAGFERYGVTPVKVVGYSSNLNFVQFHQDIINALTHKQLVVYETSHAYALPDGQQGVDYHFVLLGGIDSLRGYLTCNGDTYTALKSKTPVSPVWYGIGSLQASIPCGYIILPAIPEPAPPPPPQPPTPVVAAPQPPAAPPLTPEVVQVEVQQVASELQKFISDLSAFLGGYKL